MKLFDRLLGRKSTLPAEQKQFGVGYPLPVSGGWIPNDWPWNFWQQGKDPIGYGKDCSTVYACASAYAQTIATCVGDHWRKEDDNGRTRITTRALSRFLRRPNEYQTRSDFMLNLVQQLMLTGNAYAVGFRNERREFDSVHLLNSRTTHPYIDPQEKGLFYGVSSNSNPMLREDIEMMVPARDVLHIRLYTPDHPMIGVSPIRYAAMAIASNNAITGHQAVFFNNMSRPSGIISTDQVLNREQMMSLREAWKAQSSDLNAGGVPILGGGMKWQSMSISSQDAQLVDAFKMSVEEIARAFRVPLPLIGDNRYSTFNNVEQLVSSWLATGLGFVLEHVELSIGNYFGLPPSEIINFDTDTLLRTDFAGRIDALTKGITGGLYSPNEARAKEGLPSVAFGEEPRLQAQVVPLSQVNAEPVESAPTADAADAPDINPEAEKVIALYEIRKKMKEAAA